MKKKLLKNMEWSILVVCVLLTIIGLFALFSATQNTDYEEFRKQIKWILISVPFFILAISIDYNAIIRFSTLAYLVELGLLVGVLFMLALDSIIPHLHLNTDKPEGIKTKIQKTTMMVLAVTLHNIPEGMAVGVVFAGAIAQNTGITMTGAIALAVGIAIQNFPEGAIISMPLKNEGMSKSRAFLYGVLSGIVEPIVKFIVERTGCQLAFSSILFPFSILHPKSVSQ